jgi:hypothetical protein
MVEKNARFQRNPDFIHRRIVDETVLVPIHKDIADMNAIYVLNEVGDFIWAHLETPASGGELINGILEVFDAEPDVIEQDLDHFLDELLSIGAVRRG